MVDIKLLLPIAPKPQWLMTSQAGGIIFTYYTDLLCKRQTTAGVSYVQYIDKKSLPKIKILPAHQLTIAIMKSVGVLPVILMLSGNGHSQ